MVIYIAVFTAVFFYSPLILQRKIRPTLSLKTLAFFKELLQQFYLTGICWALQVKIGDEGWWLPFGMFRHVSACFGMFTCRYMPLHAASRARDQILFI
jgi:hypothetical protein